jgi:hypothetical protein
MTPGGPDGRDVRQLSLLHVKRPLFTERSIERYFDEKRRLMHQEVQHHISPANLLRVDLHELASYLVEKYSIRCPALRLDDAFMHDSMAPVDEPRSWEEAYGRTGLVAEAPRYSLHIPYSGDFRVFVCTPNPVSWGGPAPEALLRSDEVVITWHEPTEASATELQPWFKSQVDALSGFLNQLRINIDAFNARLPDLVRDLVMDRRGRHERARGVAKAIGYPLERRSDASEFEVPVRRRILMPQPQPQASPAATPEYRLGEAEYEATLAVLEHQRNALERSPSLTEHLAEPEIRLLLLVGLNAVFEGQAMGEVFNSQGKTDILIRVEDNNVFVAECKIWYGEEEFRKAIDQLLGYLTWRDTKGALLLFIRNVDVTAVIGKAVAAIRAHPCLVDTLPVAGDGTSRRDFILHAQGDPERRIRLAFMPFAL